MTPRTAKIVTRGLLVLALALVATTFIASAPASRYHVTAPIVVGDKSLSDGPAVFKDIQRQIAEGHTHLATGANLGTVLAFAIALLWLTTGTGILPRTNGP